MDIDLSDLEFADSVPAAVRRAWANARVLYDAQAVSRAVDQLAVQLTVRFQNTDPTLVTLLPDGAVFAGMLLRRLVFPMQYGVLQLQAGQWSYSNAEQSLSGCTVLLVGAGGDAGVRADAVAWLQKCRCTDVVQVTLIAPESEGQASGGNLLAALHDDRLPAMGTGFNFHGYGANLPGLYNLTT